MTTLQKALDLDAVQAFVRIAELRSFTRAAEALDSTQAAVSLQLKRLEQRLGCRLVDRTPRMVRLSAAGTVFLGDARALLAAHARALSSLAEAPRRLVLGISDHVGGPGLPGLLAHLAAHDPGLVIEARVGLSREVMAAFDAGDLDAAIVREQGQRGDGTVLARDAMGWFASPGFQHRPGAKLPLATLAEPCGVRDLAARLLTEAGIAWSESFVGGGVAAVAAAVSAGLGVAALARRVAPAEAIEMGEALGLPPLPAAPVMLHSRVADPRSGTALRGLGAALRRETS